MHVDVVLRSIHREIMVTIDKRNQLHTIPNIILINADKSSREISLMRLHRFDVVDSLRQFDFAISDHWIKND